MFRQLHEQGGTKNVPIEIHYFLLTSGGTAPLGQVGLISLIPPRLSSPEESKIRVHAENLGQVRLNGLSLHDGAR